MSTPRPNQTRVAAVLIALIGTFASAGPEPARAGERVCVVCTGPDAQYSCSPAPADRRAARLGLGGAALKVRCIREIAQAYGHATCKVGDVAIKTCAGTGHMLAAPAEGAAMPARATPAAPGGSPAGAAPGTGDDKTAAPKTVVEMAKRTAGETQEQLEKSGKVVERAARQTWRCVTSLFTACDAAPGREAERAPSKDQ